MTATMEVLDPTTPTLAPNGSTPPVVVTPTKDPPTTTTSPDDPHHYHRDITPVTHEQQVLVNAAVDERMDGPSPSDSHQVAAVTAPLLQPKDDTSSVSVTTTPFETTEVVSTTTTTTSSDKKKKKRPAALSNDHQSRRTANPNTGSDTPSPSAVATNWKQASMVHAELAALKQRGLAKLLNRHFTATAQQLAMEQAAADAAILDLQERKARTKEFAPQTSSFEISPLDQACIQANKWRTECRRKERETLLLYQQYVHKFGPTTILPVPTVPNTTTTTTTTREGTTTMHVVVPTAPMVPPQPAARPVPTLVPSRTAQIEQTLEEYCARGAVMHPSILTHGREQTYSSVAAKEEHAFREYYRKQLEAKGVDAVCSPGYYKGNGTDGDIAAGHNGLQEKNDNAIEDWNKDDVCSIVSGLTTLHSAMTREFIYDCEHSVQTFLREEQATVRQLLEQEEEEDRESSSGDTHVSHVHVVQDSDATAKAAENMVQQMQEILQEYNLKHFWSSNDTVQDDGLVATEQPKKYPMAYPTHRSDETWVIYYDEFYRQEYYHEVHTNRTQWDPPGRTTSRDPPDSSFSHSHSTEAHSVGADHASRYDELGCWYHHDEVGDDEDRMDRIIESNNHRVAAYRKRQRRKRLRRRMIAAIMAMVCFLLLIGGTYHQTCYQNDSHKPSACAVIDEIVMDQWHQWKEMVMPSMKPSIPDVPPVYEQCILQLTDEIEILARRQQMAVSATDCDPVAVIRRPWGCNIPLAYLFHSKCRRMASTQPIFDLQALVNSMIQ